MKIKSIIFFAILAILVLSSFYNDYLPIHIKEKWYKSFLGALPLIFLILSFILGAYDKSLSLIGVEIPKNHKQMVDGITLLLFIIVTIGSYLHTMKVTQKESTEKQRLFELSLLEKKCMKGNRTHFLELRDFSSERKHNFSENLRQYFEESYGNILKSYKSNMQSYSRIPLTSIDTDIEYNWSVESLCHFINYTPNGYRNGLDDQRTQFAAIDQMAHQKETRLVSNLMTVVDSHPNLFISFRAAKAIAEITDYAAYRQNSTSFEHPKRRFISDIPNLQILKKWWSSTGQNNSNYNLTYKEIESFSDATSNNFLPMDEFTQIKRENIISLILKYPELSFCKAVLAYMYLDDEPNKSKLLAEESLAISNSSALPLLILSELEFRKGNNLAGKSILDKCIKRHGVRKTELELRVKPLFQYVTLNQLN